MKNIADNITDNIADELKNDSEVVFSTSDDDFFKRAAKTANNQQGTKDLFALGLASIWVVFVSLFMKILKPAFKRMVANKNTMNTYKTTNGNN